jgi:SAM-dependent methyltransferase
VGSGPTALERAAPLLLLPGSRAAPLARGDVLEEAPGHRQWRVENGVLDLLGTHFAPTLTQRMLDTRATAWIYDLLRDGQAPRLGMPSFEREVDDVASRLGLAPGDTVLDVACGHGNFTTALARRVGPDGLVIGLDIASAMLARAARRVRAARLSNVLLIRGDALALPFGDGSVRRLNCSGGLHQFPSLERACAEFARVLAPGGALTASGFAESGEGSAGWRAWLRRGLALHVQPLAPLSRALAAAGFRDVATQSAGPVGYAWARRVGGR